MEQSIITVNGRALREGSIIAAEVPRNTKYGGTIWTCYEVVHNKNSSIPFIADIIGNVCQEDDWLDGLY